MLLPLYAFSVIDYLNPIYGFDQQGWYGMFVACGIWCLADVSSVHCKRGHGKISSPCQT